MKESKSLKRIGAFLLFVCLLTTLLQVSRSELVFRWDKSAHSFHKPSELPARNALSPEDKEKIHPERLVIVFDPHNPFSVKIKQNAEQVLTGMKKSFESIEIGRAMPWVEKPDAVIVALPDLSLLGGIESLERYVSEGGNVFLAAVPDTNDTFYNLYRKLGILEIGNYVDTKGIVFQTNVLPGYANVSFKDESLQNTVMHVKLNDHSLIQATAGNGIPIMWKTPYEKGAFLVFNGTMLQEKASRGLLAGGIAVLLPDFMYPVMNAKVMYLDDFPAPIRKGTNPAIYRDYQLDVPQFIKRVWWPDMIRLARTYDLKYTGALIATYNNRVTAPFDWKREAEQEDLLIFGRELLKNGGEIAVHGYNHQSLTANKRVSHMFGYKSWTGTADMAQSLEAVKQYVHTVFPNYPLRTYVPPSNALGEDGRQVLRRVLPDLQNVSSLYGEDGRGLSYVQEYELAPDGIVELPRVTYGYRIGEYEKWMMANAIATSGVFSHFIHPDDVLDHNRSQDASWLALYKDFEEYLMLVKERHGWLRSMTASEASAEAEKMLISEPVIERSKEGLKGYINRFTGDLYFMLRTDKRIARTENCDVHRIDDGVYLVRAEKETFTIEWTEKK